MTLGAASPRLAVVALAAALSGCSATTEPELREGGEAPDVAYVRLRRDVAPEV